jgi:tetratricopeptide (TPR) repeat protein
VDYQFLDNYKWAGEALVNCATDACDTNTLKSGVHYYYHLSKIFPNISAEYNAIGFCFYYLKEYREAQTYFSKAISLDSKNSGLYFNLGMNFLQMKEYDKALNALTTGKSQLAPLTLLLPNFISHPRVPGISAEQSAKMEYLNAVLQYEALLTLTEGLLHTDNAQQKKDLAVQLQEKITQYKLFYYMPIYKLNYQGKKLTGV